MSNSVSSKGWGTTEYRIDAFGRRVAKVPASSSNLPTFFMYDQAGRLLGEYSGYGGSYTEYIWANGVPVAMVTASSSTATPTLYYIHTDHLGTPRQVTVPNNSVTTPGKLVWEWKGEPFGTSYPNEDPTGSGTKFTMNLRHAGQYYDKETGLFNNGFRDYNPVLGRYMQSDPIGLAGGVNTYAYVNAQPTRYTDPDGLQPVPRGIYLPRGPAISGPPTMAENGGWGSTRSITNQFGNWPNPAPQLPDGWVGVNVPWAMPNLIKVCDGPYLGFDPNAGGVCRAPSANSQGPFLSAPGQGPARSCTSWHYVQAPG